MAKVETFIEVKDPVEIVEGGEPEDLLRKKDEEGVEYADLTKSFEDTTVTKVVETKPVAVKTAPAPAQTEQDSDIPEDLRGKSTSQLAKMYSEARSTIGRQGKDLGDLRKLADRYIQAGLQGAIAARQPAVEAPKPKTKEERDVEFFANPSEAIAKAVEEHPAVKEAREATQRMISERQIETAMRTKDAFHKAYPKALEAVADPAFQQWVGASKVRTALLHHADKSYDLDAAHEIFGGWETAKAAKAGKTAAVAPAAPAKQTQVREPAAGGVPTGGSAGTSGAPSGGGKIYRRADIMDMMVNRPKEYADRAVEIQQAYQERRVR